MRSLAVVVVVLASGCAGNDAPFCGDGVVNGGLEECDDGNLVVGDGCSPTCEIEDLRIDTHVTVSWTFRSLALNAAVECPAGYDTAAVYAQPVSLNYVDDLGPPVVELHDCASGQGPTAGLPRGRYRVWLEIVNSTSSDVYFKSSAVHVDTSYFDQSFNETIYTDGGYFELAWTLVGAQYPVPPTCGENGVETIVLVDGYGPRISPCWRALAGPYLAGPHTLTIEARGLGADRGTLTVADQVAPSQSQITDLGTFEIPVTPP